VRTGAAKGRFNFLPYLDSLTGETQAHRNAYPQMLREPSVKAGILEKVLSIAALDVATNTTGDGPNDEAAADFAGHLIGQIRATDWDVAGLPAFCETVILPGLIMGYSISEKTWHVEERGRWKGRLLLRLKSRMPGQQVDLEVDEHNNITAVIGRGASSGQRFEPHQFVIWRHLPLWDSPAGTSDLRAAYRAYFCIDTATKLRMIFLSKFAAGPMLKGTYADSGQRGELEDAMESAAANTWISIPDGVQVEMVDLAMKGTSDFKSAVDDFQQEVLLGISGATLQALQGDVANARGNSSVHKATADLRKWYISACVTSLLNTQVLTDATDLNFPAGTAVPEVSLGGVDDGDMALSMTVDAGLSTMGVELSKEDLRKRYGRPEPTDEADTAVPAGAGLGLGLGLGLPGAAQAGPSKLWPWPATTCAARSAGSRRLRRYRRSITAWSSRAKRRSPTSCCCSGSPHRRHRSCSRRPPRTLRLLRSHRKTAHHQLPCRPCSSSVSLPRSIWTDWQPRFSGRRPSSRKAIQTALS